MTTMTVEPPPDPDFGAGGSFVDLLLGVVALGNRIEAHFENWAPPADPGDTPSSPEGDGPEDTALYALLGVLALARTSRRLAESLACDVAPEGAATMPLITREILR